MMFDRKHLFSLLFLAAASTSFVPRIAAGCPFCSSVRMTFGEEVDRADVVVFARLVKMPPEASGDAGLGDVGLPQNAMFEIAEVLKGKQFLDKQSKIETLYFGEKSIGQLFLIFGLEAPNIAWTTPIPISERVQTYLKEIDTLPESPDKRLPFFLGYLEDEEEMLAADAYDEFARAPYDDVKVLKDSMDHDRLVEWIQNSEIPPSRRRLYLVMLGVCGNTDDAQLLESMMKSDDRSVKAGLDAMIGCYLTLMGEKGLPLVEDTFLKNKDAEYTDTYAAIMALRFHGKDAGVIDKLRIVEAMRHMLARPQLADLVIPDLARWEDWSCMPRLIELFKLADEDSSWVRVPVVNFLRACPLPEAKQAIAELEKIDPESVTRAREFFPNGAPTDSSENDNAAKDNLQEEVAGSAGLDGDSVAAADEKNNAAKDNPQAEVAGSAGLDGDSVAASEQDRPTDELTSTLFLNGDVSIPVVLGGAIVAGLALLLLMWVILRSPPHQIIT